jgi:hypothetical protein
VRGFTGVAKGSPFFVEAVSIYGLTSKRKVSGSIPDAQSGSSSLAANISKMSIRAIVPPKNTLAKQRADEG